MANPQEVIEVTDPAPRSAPKPALLTLLATIVGSTVISVLVLGAAGFYLMRSGRLSPTTVAAPAAVAKVEVAPPPATHAIALEPMVVNLADDNGKAYLRLGLTLRVEDPAIKKGEKPKEEKPKDIKGASEAEVAARDTALEVLGQQTSAALLAQGGKEALKTRLRAAMLQEHPEIKMHEIFFTEFLVQR